MGKPDDFSIDLSVKHPSLEPSAISKALGIQPKFAWRAGDPAGARVHNSTFWRGTLFRGHGAAEFEKALPGVLSILSDRQSFLNQIAPAGGELTLTFRHVAEAQKGKTAELSLRSPLLGALAHLGAALVVEIWLPGDAD